MAFQKSVVTLTLVARATEYTLELPATTVRYVVSISGSYVYTSTTTGEVATYGGERVTKTVPLDSGPVEFSAVTNLYIAGRVAGTVVTVDIYQKA